MEDEKEVSMFRRIIDMREKLEGIIQLQTIKYQRQLALMLRDSKRKQREQELQNVLDAANGTQPTGVDIFASHPSPQRVFGTKYPPMIKTQFVPTLGVLESPYHGAESHSGALSRISSSGEPLHQMDSDNVWEDSVTPPAAALGGNIYAGNLKMMDRAEEEEKRRKARLEQEAALRDETD